MLIRDWMSRDVITLNITDSLKHAMNVSLEKGVSLLPVLEDGRLVGIVTDRDLKRASPSSAPIMDMQQVLYQLSRLTVGEVMSRNPITIPRDYTVEETAEVLLTNNISGVPVVDDEANIVGIITKNDLFKAVISLTGLPKKGVHLGFLLDDRPGSIKEVVDIIRGHHGRLASILSSYERAPQGFRHVYVRAFDIDAKTLPQLVKELKAKARLLYVVDHGENKREIYENETPAEKAAKTG